MFLTGALVFTIQPMAGKTLLPLWGGHPGDWNFLTGSISAAGGLGFLGAWLLSQYLSIRDQARCLIALWAANAFQFVVWNPPGGDFWLVSLLPTIFLAHANLFLLPYWSCSIDGPHSTDGSRDGYLLLAIAFFAGLVSALAYLLVLEPNVEVVKQVLSWKLTAGAVCVLLIGYWAACGKSLPIARSVQGSCSTRSAWRQRLRWVILSALPGSIVLATTTVITVNVSPIPLLYIVLLGFYGVSLVLAFSRIPFGHPLPLVLSLSLQIGCGLMAFFLVMLIVGEVMQKHLLAYGIGLGLAVLILMPHRLTIVLQPLFALFGLALFWNSNLLDVSWALAIFFIALWESCWGCHGALAQERPRDPLRIREFLLCVAVGNVVAWLILSSLVPVLFPSFLVEYPLFMILACVIRFFPRPNRECQS
ncbi:MAG: hypothetical protein L0215_12645 [Gemmataceae bacterium]|nr:hypothetical protein [Gemmataceae bacterium]